MYIDIKKIDWLLFDSKVKNNEIAKKCQVKLKMLYKLKKEKMLVTELDNDSAHRLTLFAQELIELTYYEEYRWVVTQNRQLDLYSFRNINVMNRDAKLVSQVHITPEVKKYESIKKIQEEYHLFSKHLDEARKSALSSVGF